MNKYLSKAFIFIALLFYQVTALAAPPPKDVNVVNTPDVNVVSMPPVEATVSGPIDANITEPVEVTAPGGLDVNVQNMPGVTIENGPLEPVPVTIDTHQRELVHEYIIISIPAGNTSTGGNGVDFYTVPSDKIFVLQHVSITKDYAGNSSYIDRAWIMDGLNRMSFIPQISSSRGDSVINQQVTKYYQPNATLDFGAFLTSAGTTSVNIIVSLTGYLIPTDSPSLAP